MTRAVYAQCMKRSPIDEAGGLGSDVLPDEAENRGREPRRLVHEWSYEDCEAAP